MKDPDAIRVGNDYYLTSSSFEDIPGLPILHSTDLVNWSIIGHALLFQPPFERFMKSRLEKGFGHHLYVSTMGSFLSITRP
ncbi:family 43 glycosylhydrolase [Pedobacter superstes]|uniref:family 43 glycosylhydrolase n=1 Tax=Pedobacter superstes TaxID=3133441 RepID=UPI003D70E21B